MLDDGRHCEIKTCYRVDQLGSCTECGASVSSLESACAKCGSIKIARKDDSKWLISIRHDDEFKEILEPHRYYFVLFEFDDIRSALNNDIVASIWEVDPTCKGFAYCMMDYYVNIRANSKSGAAFNMWPHSPKFAMTKPKLIYRSVISADGGIATSIFPELGNGYVDELKPLTEYAGKDTLTVAALEEVLQSHGLAPPKTAKAKLKFEMLRMLEALRHEGRIANGELCDALADAIYLPLVVPKKHLLPPELTYRYPCLM